MVRIIAEEEPIESYYQVKEELNNNRLSGSGDHTEDNAKIDIKRAVVDINMSKYIQSVISLEMSAVLDLVGMYSEIN